MIEIINHHPNIQYFQFIGNSYWILRWYLSTNMQYEDHSRSFQFHMESFLGARKGFSIGCSFLIYKPSKVGVYYRAKTSSGRLEMIPWSVVVRWYVLWFMDQLVVSWALHLFAIWVWRRGEPFKKNNGKQKKTKRPIFWKRENHRWFKPDFDRENHRWFKSKMINLRDFDRENHRW